MRIVKITVWLLLLYVIQTVFTNLIKINGVAPELILVFAIVYSFNESNFAPVSYIAIICGIITGCIMGNSFPISVLVIGVFGVIAFYSKTIMKFIPAIVRCTAVTAAAAFLLCSMHCFIEFKKITMYGFFGEIIPYTVYTTVVSAVMYPIIIRVFFKEKDEKKLLIL